MSSSYSYDFFYQLNIPGWVYALCIVSMIFVIACQWKIFEKADIAGWKVLIPFYNQYCYFKIIWGNGWFFLLLFIPFVNVVIAIISLYKLAQVFGKGVGFFFGLWFLSIIFYPILAFGSAEYKGIDA